MRRAEAALVEHYPHLVRLAYVVLPPGLGRHRRVLAAHAVVQRALPAVGGGAPTARVPAQSRRSSPTGEATGTDSGTGTDTGTAYGWMRLRVLRTALAYERRPRWWPGRLPAPAALRPTVPVVWGLRLFPRAGGVDELALDRALSRVDGAARAAFALQVLEGLDASAVRDLLARAAVDDPADAVRRAAGLGSPDRDGARAMLGSGEFDPCTVQTRPSDLLRRRQRVRAAAVAAALCVLAGGLEVAVEESTRATGADRSPAGALAPVLDPAKLLRTAAEQWADTSRVDFTAWPARGGRRAIRSCSAGRCGPGRSPRVRCGSPPRRVRAPCRPSSRPGCCSRARWTARPSSFPRQRGPGGAVRGAAVRDRRGGARLRPDRRRGRDDGRGGVIGRTGRRAVPPRPLDRRVHHPGPASARHAGPGRWRWGVTGSRRRHRAALGGACDAWPVLQLRSSERIVEKHAFLVTDLGDLAPVHLTYTPKPGRGAPARQPREATGPEALLAWARTACSLRPCRPPGCGR
ncbi:hypothetical protein SCALM49S_08085 [Streptomyces californicus]